MLSSVSPLIVLTPRVHSSSASANKERVMQFKKLPAGEINLTWDCFVNNIIFSGKMTSDFYGTIEATELLF